MAYYLCEMHTYLALGSPKRDLQVACYTSPCGAYGMLVGWIWQIRSLRDFAENWWGASDDASLSFPNTDSFSAKCQN
jgi:hypothetical protein